jgi:hypothetical protein
VLLIRAGAPLDEVEREDLCILAATSASAVYALIDRGVVIRDLQGDSRIAEPARRCMRC